MGRVVDRTVCPSCKAQGKDTSEDNLVIYDDDTAYCFACGHTEREAYIKQDFHPIQTVPISLPSRKLTQKTVDYYGVGISEDKQNVVFPYYDAEGNLVAQKLKSKDKKYSIHGTGTNLALFGQHKFNNPNRKVLVITEGEEDAMAVHQTTGYCAVSVPNGSTGARSAIQRNLNYINKFDTVMLFFDNDEPGNKAFESCRDLIKPGRLKKVKATKYKDACEYLTNSDSDELKNILQNALPVKPNKILHVSEINPDNDTVSRIWTYPFDKLTTELYGRASGELCMHTSGTGMGKSTVIREMALHDIFTSSNDECVGICMLEESISDTLNDMIGLLLNKPVRRIMEMRKLKEHPEVSSLNFNIEDDLTDEEYKQALDKLYSTGLFVYNHFGSVEDNNELLNAIEYMILGCNCTRIYLDHISIVISGQETGNERKDIDVLMTELKSLAKRTGAHIDVVSHLSRPAGKAHEEGGTISLKELRGSSGLGQISDSVLGYERNQHHPDPVVANTILVRSLKARRGGRTGLVGGLRFNKSTGRLDEVEITQDENGVINYYPADAFEDKELANAAIPV